MQENLFSQNLDPELYQYCLAEDYDDEEQTFTFTFKSNDSKNILSFPFYTVSSDPNIPPVYFGEGAEITRVEFLEKIKAAGLPAFREEPKYHPDTNMSFLKPPLSAQIATTAFRFPSLPDEDLRNLSFELQRFLDFHVGRFYESCIRIFPIYEDSDNDLRCACSSFLGVTKKRMEAEEKWASALVRSFTCEYDPYTDSIRRNVMQEFLSQGSQPYTLARKKPGDGWTYMILFVWDACTEVDMVSTTFLESFLKTRQGEIVCYDFHCMFVGGSPESVEDETTSQLLDFQLKSANGLYYVFVKERSAETLMKIMEICGDEAFVTQDREGYVFRMTDVQLSTLRIQDWITDIRPYTVVMLRIV